MLHFVAHLLEFVCQLLYSLFLGIEPETGGKRRRRTIHIRQDVREKNALMVFEHRQHRPCSSTLA